VTLKAPHPRLHISGRIHTSDVLVQALQQVLKSANCNNDVHKNANRAC
jgi:hypothetical protein